MKKLIFNNRNVFFTSDWHFDHGNIIKYTNRPFLTPEDQAIFVQNPDMRVSFDSIRLMNNTIINNINLKVKEDDVIFHLGDVTFTKDKEKARSFLDRINCREIYNIWGNHDDYFTLKDLFKETFDQVKVVVDGQEIFLNHYAMRVWDKSHRGTWHLYGHSHGQLPDDPESLSFDAGVDCHNFMPLSMADIRAIMNKKTPVDPNYKDRARKENYNNAMLEFGGQSYPHPY